MFNKNLFYQIFIIIVLVLLGCSTQSLMYLSPSESSYMERANACPLIFIIDKTEEEAAWGRAQSWLVKHSSMKIQTVTNFIIQTYTPAGRGVDYGYNIIKTLMKDEVQIEVQCGSQNPFAVKDAKNNAHLLAYFIKTGDPTPSRLVVK